MIYLVQHTFIAYQLIGITLSMNALALALSLMMAEAGTTSVSSRSMQRCSLTFSMPTLALP